MKHLMQNFLTCIAGEYISRVQALYPCFQYPAYNVQVQGVCGWWLTVGATSIGASQFNIEKYLNDQEALS